MYIVSKIFWAVAQPSTLLLLLSLAGVAVLYWRAHSPSGWRLLLIGIGGLAACAIFPIGTWLMQPLEDRFSQPRPMPERVDGIVLLGGAIDLDESANRGMLALNARAERMIDFVALARRYPNAELVFSGGDPHLFSTGQHWLLVTSAADMPRAVGCFRAVHWSVIPYPVDYHTKQQSIGMFPGLVAGLQRIDWATHEWLGLAYYRMRGWIPSFFPAPG